MKVSTEFVHLVRFDEVRSVAIVDRLFPDGSTHLFVEIPLGKDQKSGNNETPMAAALRIGEDIMIDSPVARRILNI